MVVCQGLRLSLWNASFGSLFLRSAVQDCQETMRGQREATQAGGALLKSPHRVSQPLSGLIVTWPFAVLCCRHLSFGARACLIQDGCVPPPAPLSMFAELLGGDLDGPAGEQVEDGGVAALPPAARARCRGRGRRAGGDFVGRGQGRGRGLPGGRGGAAAGGRGRGRGRSAGFVWSDEQKVGLVGCHPHPPKKGSAHSQSNVTGIVRDATPSLE